jgi:DUF971 family protein
MEAVGRSGFLMSKANSNPNNVDISLSKGVEIKWQDGHASRYELDFLRDRCPRAVCRGHSGEPPKPNPLPMYKAAPRLTKAEPVGRYAVQLFWADGHNTGLYSFDYLREICPCAECKKQ